MRRFVLFFLLIAAVPTSASGQVASALPNGGFEKGTEGWIPSTGAYGGAQASWTAAASRARLISSPVHSGRAALLLDAMGLNHEVDVSSAPVQIVPGHAYRLVSFVRQVRGSEAYKVTIDWQAREGRHLRYDNDWRGGDRPKAFAEHGGVFLAPAEAGRAVIILGVQKAVACVFDDLSLIDLGVTEPLNARPRHDGDGRAEIEGPATIPAHGFGTWRITYTCGPSGLPVGGSIVLRRYSVSYDWSSPQGKQPRAAGFVTASGPRGAFFDVESAQEQAVKLRLQWPAFLPGERVQIVVGDRRGRGPGIQTQRTARGGLQWIAGSDCDGDGEWRDLADQRGGGFDVVAGPPAGARVILPVVAEAGTIVEAAPQTIDAYGNVVPDSARATVISNGPGGRIDQRIPVKLGVNAVSRIPMRWSTPGTYAVRVQAPGIPQRPQDGSWIVIGTPIIEPEIRDAQPVARVSGSRALIANDRVALALSRVAGRWGAGFLLVRTGESWRRAAAMPAVGRILFGGGHRFAPGGMPGDLFYADSIAAGRDCAAAALTLRGVLHPDSSPAIPFTATYRLAAGSSQIETRFAAAIPRPIRLASLHTPILYTGDGSSQSETAGALLPGLEFLKAGEVSSDDAGVAWALRERWIPHPYKITVPLMAAGIGGSVVGLAWDPLQKWDGVHPIPLAHFASPDRPEAKACSLMSLLVPGFGAGFRENVPGVPNGMVIPAGSTISVSAGIFALFGTEDVSEAVRWWTENHSRPAPEPCRTPAEALALSARGFMKTAWVPAAHGWFTAVGLKPGFVESIADPLLQIRDGCGDPALASTAAGQAKEAIGAVGGPQGSSLSLRTGDAESAVAELRRAAYGWIGKQQPDGSWTFADVYSTEGARAGLARPDDVELGTCVNPLEPILDYAVATGDPRAVEAGMLGLKFIERFYKPAGSESWEVPLVCPNLRAAALAARCCLRGWQLTGDEKYLQRARRWAWAGAAFIHQWRAPDRPAMPGASISVMGTSFYDGFWFGRAVQWVGLVYAEVLQELARYDRSDDWRRLAELITASALRQQKTDAAACGHVGLFPDSYSIVEGADSYEWCLAPVGIVDNVLGLMGYPYGYCFHAVRTGDGFVHILGDSVPVAASWDDAAKRLSLTLRAAPGSASQVVLYGLRDPPRVTWAGAPLPRLSAPDAEGPGWFTGRTEAAIILRLKWQDAQQVLTVEGAESAPYRGPGFAPALINGGFESGAQGWNLEPASRIDTERPHGGTAALRIDAPDPRLEGQASSVAFAVEGGRPYRLRAWVWEIKGDGDYKVTIEWLGPGGEHLAYANDWQGTNRPRIYSEHGGVFAAPAGAAVARIILGCRGSTCLFDDITFVPGD